MPIVYMQLPEGTDPKKLNGTMFMIPGEGDEFVGPPGTNQSMTVVILPTEALNGLNLALPGLSGRRNFIFGREGTRNGQRTENGFQTKVFQKTDRKGNSTSNLDERSNSFDPRDIPFDDDWDNSRNSESGRGYDIISGDEREEDAPEISSSSDAPRDGRPIGNDWNVRSTRRGQGIAQKEVVDSKNRRKEGDRNRGTKKQNSTPKPGSSNEGTDEQQEQEPEERPNFQPAYGSRRTIWGYPTRGQIPYPSYVSKPYPKERPTQEPLYGSANACSACPLNQYPVRGEALYPPANGQQETFIELPDADVYSSGYDSSNRKFVEYFPTDGNTYGSDTQPSYSSNSDMSSSDFPGYGPAVFTNSDLGSAMISSQTGSLLELPSRSRIPSLLDTRTVQDPLTPLLSSSKNYPLAGLIDGRGQVRGYYFQTGLQDNTRPASSNVQNILERLLTQSNRFTTLSDLVDESVSGEESTFVPMA